MDSPVIAPRSLTCRSRKTNKPRKMVLDGRSLLGRRVLDLADAFAAALGGWTGLGDMLAANVRRAAELVALAEQARATALRTGTIDAAMLARLDGAASRAVRALGITESRRKATAMTLRDRLAAEAEAQ
jgi:hypothetical protein